MRVSEIYLSVQGEGPNVGIRTVFVRFAGCNLRCSLWPCDTPHAIFPETYRHEWRKMTAVQIFAEILEITGGDTNINVCLTGGEPFLQSHAELQELIVLCKNHTVEAFTNGALLYPEWLKTSGVTIIMDWKLSGSGENPFEPNRIENLEHKLDTLTAYVKFTIADDEDYELAKIIYEKYVRSMGFNVYYGVAWKKITNVELVDKVIEDQLPWRLNMQIHNYIWNREKRGI